MDLRHHKQSSAQDITGHNRTASRQDSIIKKIVVEDASLKTENQVLLPSAKGKCRYHCVSSITNIQ
eukprot:c38850_g1_i1 orf=2-196(-)